MYDLSSNTEKRITTDTTGQYYPSIYGDKIVYEDYRNGNSDIYMYDLSSNTEKRITTDNNEQYNPAIYGDKIVWQDYRNGNWDIYMKDLSENLLPQSKLSNLASSPLSGTLKLILQKNISGSWVNQTVILRSVTIPGNGFLKLDVGKDNLGSQVFEGFNNLNVYASSLGDYRIYARFEANSKFIDNSWNFKVA